MQRHFTRLAPAGIEKMKNMHHRPFSLYDTRRRNLWRNSAEELSGPIHQWKWHLGTAAAGYLANICTTLRINCGLSELTEFDDFAPPEKGNAVNVVRFDLRFFLREAV